MTPVRRSLLKGGAAACALIAAPALLRAQTDAQIRAVLTPDQRQKLADLRAPRRAGQSGKS